MVLMFGWVCFSSVWGEGSGLEGEKGGVMYRFYCFLYAAEDRSGKVGWQ